MYPKSKMDLARKKIIERTSDERENENNENHNIVINEQVRTSSS